MYRNAAIQKILYDELDRTKAVYEQTKTALNVVISEIPSGLPLPEGPLRITSARQDNSAALNGWVAALRDINEFILRGNVPERLRHHGKR